MSGRSERVDVRNPLLKLPAMQELLARDDRELLVPVLRDIQRDARERADKCWRTHKAPMAAYWKAVSVYAGHLARSMTNRNLRSR